MTLQANKSDIGARQHSRIGRAVRLMTRLAAFKAHRGMLESEWTALVAVTAEASRLISGKSLEHGGPDAAVGIVAVDAAHVAFGKLVMERTLELGPLVQVAACAQLVRGFGFTNHQRLTLMHFMASGTGNLIPGVAALEPADLRGLVQMTGQTDFVGGRGDQVRRVAD